MRTITEVEAAVKEAYQRLWYSHLTSGRMGEAMMEERAAGRLGTEDGLDGLRMAEEKYGADTLAKDDPNELGGRLAALQWVLGENEPTGDTPTGRQIALLDRIELLDPIDDDA